MANNMIVESPTAAHRLRDGAMLVAIGRTMPRPPTISANPMKAVRPGVMPTGPFFSDCALNFSYANSFTEPTAMKTNARSPWTIHRVRFMHSNFNYFNEQLGDSLQQVTDFCRGFRSVGIAVLLLFKVCPAESDAFESPKSAPRPHAALPCLYVRSRSPRQGRNHAAHPTQGRTLHRIGP